MKPKMIEAGQPIKVGELSLTILLELEAGRDKRIYKVKDQRGALYIYKHCKKRTVKKEIARAEILTRIGLPHSKVVASGSDFIVRAWVPGVRGDDWLKAWESFGAPVDVDAVEKLVALFDKAASAGMYVGRLNPEDLIYDESDWWILDCGSIRKHAPRDVATRYFWRIFERWGSKLDRHRKSLANLLEILSFIGKDPAFGGTGPAFGGTSPAFGGTSPASPLTAGQVSGTSSAGVVVDSTNLARPTDDAYTEASPLPVADEEEDSPPSSGDSDDDDDDDDTESAEEILRSIEQLDVSRRMRDQDPPSTGQALVPQNAGLVPPKAGSEDGKNGTE